MRERSRTLIQQACWCWVPPCCSSWYQGCWHKWYSPICLSFVWRRMGVSWDIRPSWPRSRYQGYLVWICGLEFQHLYGFWRGRNPLLSAWHGLRPMEHCHAIVWAEFETAMRLADKGLPKWKMCTCQRFYLHLLTRGACCIWTGETRWFLLPRWADWFAVSVALVLGAQPDVLGACWQQWHKHWCRHHVLCDERWLFLAPVFTCIGSLWVLETASLTIDSLILDC